MEAKIIKFKKGTRTLLGTMQATIQLIFWQRIWQHSVYILRTEGRLNIKIMASFPQQKKFQGISKLRLAVVTLTALIPIYHERDQKGMNKKQNHSICSGKVCEKASGSEQREHIQQSSPNRTQ